MTFDEYQDESARTYKHGRLAGHALGLAGEAGEVADLVKKRIYHDVPYEVDKMSKELGDVLWYLSALANEHGLRLADIAQQNVDKLKARYPLGFQPGGGIR